MTAFSASDAAFTGFRIARERWRALPFWVAANIVLSLALMAALQGLPNDMPSPDMVQADPQTFVSYAVRAAPVFLLVLGVGLVGQSLIASAMYRAVLKPDQAAFGYLRLGADELRVLAATLIYAVIVFGVEFAVVLAAGLIGAAANTFAPAAGVWVNSAALAAAVCVVMAVAVRLSLLGPLAFDSGRVHLPRAWRMTKARFWSIFGAYALAIALALVVAVLGLVVEAGVEAALGGEAPASASTFAALHPLTQLASPAGIADLLVSALISALIWPVTFTPAAVIYGRLATATPDAGSTSA